LSEDPTLADYLAYAAANNPGLAALRSRFAAAQERVPQARSLDDPRLTYRTALATGMRTHEVMVEQMFPTPGKLDLRAAVAQQEAEAARYRVAGDWLRLAYEVKAAYYEYYYLSRSIVIVRENRDLVKYLSDVAIARFRTAAVSQADLVRAQVELGKLDDQLRSLEDSRGAAAARLNAALNRPAGAPIPWPQAIPEDKQDLPSDEQVLAHLREANPELAGMVHDVERERQAVELAKKDFWPDLGVGVGYMNQVQSMIGSDDHAVVGMVSITLPIWREKYAAGVREAELRREAAVKDKADRENRLAADLKMALYELRDAHRKINLYRDTLIPKAKESLQATEAAFRTGSANFVDLVDGQRMLLEFQLMDERALVDHAEHLAQIEMLVGRELPRAPAAAGEPAAPVGKPAAPVGKPAAPVGKPAAPVGKPAAPVGK
jgi:outer membrane protein TolC